jgi:hypothetical protein
MDWTGCGGARGIADGFLISARGIADGFLISARGIADGFLISARKDVESRNTLEMAIGSLVETKLGGLLFCF